MSLSVPVFSLPSSLLLHAEERAGREHGDVSEGEVKAGDVDMKTELRDDNIPVASLSPVEETAVGSFAGC